MKDLKLEFLHPTHPYALHNILNILNIEFFLPIIHLFFFSASSCTYKEEKPKL